MVEAMRAEERLGLVIASSFLFFAGFDDFW